nr:hypothetical protein [Kibdelosporangium sp. MJ126-NF4]
MVTLLSIAETRGGGYDFSRPESGTFVVAELKVEGKVNTYFTSLNWVRLRKPDGTLVRPDDGNGVAGVPEHEQFATEKVGPGQVATGSIAFDSELEPGAKIVLTHESGEITGEWPL